jgi:hypothetical protein
MADNIFTNAGEFQPRRGKGNRQTRLGPRVAAEGPRRAGGKAQTPDQIALNKLMKLLDKPGVLRNERYGYINMLSNAEQIRFMNMPVLAQVLLYMRNVGNKVDETTFNYQAILPYINILLPRTELTHDGTQTKKLSAEETERMRLRLAATFFRYIRYILTLQADQQQQLQTEQINEAAGVAATFPQEYYQ